MVMQIKYQKMSDIDLESEEIKGILVKLDEDKQVMDEMIAKHSLTLEKTSILLKLKIESKKKKSKLKYYKLN